MRTKIDVKTKRSVREVVDGQQRLRAILDFADDKFALSKRAEEFAGYRYSTLEADLQQVFLEYPLSVDQLVNANNDDVLEVFSRLNSYTVVLNPPEKRHAKFEGDFKWMVRSASRQWHILWDEYKIISTKRRVRMYDDSLIAELYGVVVNGVRNGGQPIIDKLYEQLDRNFPDEAKATKELNETLEFFVAEIAEHLKDTVLLNEPHFLMVFAALAHALFGIPKGEMGEAMPLRSSLALSDLSVARNNLLTLASIIESDDPVPGYNDFWIASKGQTIRIASRRVRFPVFYRALFPEIL